MSKVITDAARALIDKTWVRRYALAVKSPQPPNPLYTDESYAAGTKWGGVIAPPTLCTGFPWLGPLLDKINPSMGKYRVGLNGGNEYELYEPVRIGDVLTGIPKLAGLDEKPRDDGGVMLVINLEARFTNQRGEKVLTARQTLLRIYGPENLTQE